MEKLKLTRRRVLLTLATAPLLPLVQPKGAVAATTDSLLTSAADLGVEPLMYRREHCRGGWNVVGGQSPDE